MADYPVKWYSSKMAGAPSLALSKGTFLALFDACLLDGFGNLNLTSISVNSGVATCTVSNGDAPLFGSVVEIAGAFPDALNGKHRVIARDATTFKYFTSASDANATGTMTFKYPAVGSWEKLYSGPNKAVYRSTSSHSSRHCLRIDDDQDAKYARVRAYVEMSDVDTGIFPFPTDTQMNGGGYWHKCYTNGAGPVQWHLVADDRFVILCVGVGSAANAEYISAPARGFGDPIFLRPSGDPWCAAISVATSDGSASQGYGVFSAAQIDQGLYVSRNIDGVNPSMPAAVKSWCSGANSALSGNSAIYGAYPNAVDGIMRTSKMYIANGATMSDSPRATIPGILFIPHSNVSAYVKSGDIFDGSGGLFGRKLLAVKSRSGSVNSTNVPGVYLIDISGPWR